MSDYSLQSFKENLFSGYRIHARYLEELVKDIPAAELGRIPGPGLENHPLFTAGHLACASALLCRYLGGEYTFPEKWEPLFRRKGPGDSRLAEPGTGQYPMLHELMHEYNKQHNQVESLIATLTADDLERATTWRLSGYMPKVSGLLLFFCLSHEAMHLSQLAAWRRAMNLPSALARM